MSCTNNIIDFTPKNILFRKGQGDHFNVPLTITDNEDLPIDLSDADDIQFFVDDVEVASLGDGITVSGTDSNIVTILKADTSESGTYEYKLVITDSDGAIRTYLKAKLIVI